MSRPTLEVADIIRAARNSFWEKHGSHDAWRHRKVLDAIVRCRTAALGGHRDQCIRCGHQAISYNSCRNQHCPYVLSVLEALTQNLPSLQEFIIDSEEEGRNDSDLFCPAQATSAARLQVPRDVKIDRGQSGYTIPVGRGNSENNRELLPKSLSAKSACR
jgi:hypothetical protein